MDHTTTPATTLATDSTNHPSDPLNEAPLATPEPTNDGVTNKTDDSADVPSNKEHHGTHHTQSAFAWCIVC
ncbi:uncharacterized protein SCHCODRAFT_02691998 [Schizophyllum commune H4-8]|nr:uncharacterized protein SCHCODRAFT_02691998 [Schizophyllum commune H4-8]KAI5888699.1 hypothetical protein SCHCODRAFT_02691998 [Schizophyllum commune H4-8]